jgi:hypothetical protein
LLVVAEKRTTLRYQFPSLPLIVTHFLSNSSFPTSIAATSSAATTTTTTTTTTMTTTYDQEVVVSSGCEKRQKPPQQQRSKTCRHLRQNPKPSTHTHTHTQKQKENCVKRKRNTGPNSSQEWGPSRKPSQRTTLHHKTITAKLLQQESSNQATKQSSKQVHNPSEFFLVFFPS